MPRPTGLMRLFACGLLFLLPAVPAIADDTASLELSASRSEIYLGESFVLQVKVTQANGAEPDLSALTNAVIRKLGSQDISNYSIVIVNGRMRREGFSGRIHAYEIQPLNAGPFTAGPVRLGTRSEPGPVISVMGIETQEMVKLSVVASPATVLANEPFQISLRLQVRALPAPYSEADPFPPEDPPLLQIPYLSESVDGLEPPQLEPILNGLLARDPQRGAVRINEYSIRNDPFNMRNFFNLNGQSPFEERPARFLFPRVARIDGGSPVFEYSFDLPYRAEKEGTYTFGPVLFKGRIVVAPPGNAGQLGLQSIFAVGPAASVRVIPPPETGRPDSYINVLGSNLVVTAALDTQTCRVGDPLTLTLKVAGPAQWRNVTPLRLSLQTNLLDLFTIYQEQVQTLKADQARQFIYTLRPIKAGTFEVPPIEVSFYDAESRNYRTVRTEPLPIRVNPAAEFTAAQVVGQTTNRPARPAAATPLPALAALRTDPAGAYPASLLGSPWLPAAAGAMPILALLLWIGRAVWRRRQRFNRGWSRYRALPRARRRIQGAARFPTGDARFHQCLCDAIRGFIADRFGIEAGSLTPDEIQTRLSGQVVDSLLTRRLRQALEFHSHAQWGAPVSDTRSANQVCLALIDLLAEFNRLSPRSTSRPGPVLMLALIIGLAAGSAHAQPEENVFLWQEANNRMQNAQSPADFARAADIYRQLVERGARNGPVFINWGIALFQAGHPAQAHVAFLRAERYLGSAPEITRSLRLAATQAEQNPDTVLPWYRIPLFWHYALPCGWRVQIAAFAFILLWAGLIARLFNTGRWTRRLIWLALGVLALFGSSALTTLYLEGLLLP